VRIYVVFKSVQVVNCVQPPPLEMGFYTRCAIITLTDYLLYNIKAITVTLLAEASLI